MKRFTAEQKFESDLIPQILNSNVDEVVEYLNNCVPNLLQHIHEAEEESKDRIRGMQILGNKYHYAIRQYNAMDIIDFFQKYNPEVIQTADFEAMFWTQRVFNLALHNCLSAYEAGRDISHRETLKEYVSEVIEGLISKRESISLKSFACQNPEFDYSYYEGRDWRIRQKRRNGEVIGQQVERLGFAPKTRHINKFYLGSEVNYNAVIFYKDLLTKIELTYSAVMYENSDIDYNKELMDDLQYICELTLNGKYISIGNSPKEIDVRECMESMLNNPYKVLEDNNITNAIGNDGLEKFKKLFGKMVSKKKLSIDYLPQQYRNAYFYEYLMVIVHPYNIYLAYLNWTLTCEKSKLLYFLHLIRLAEEVMLNEESLNDVISGYTMEEFGDRFITEYLNDISLQKSFAKERSIEDIISITSIMSESIKEAVEAFTSGIERLLDADKARISQVVDVLNEQIQKKPIAQKCFKSNMIISTDSIKLFCRPINTYLYRNNFQNGPDNSLRFNNDSAKYLFYIGEGANESNRVLEEYLMPFEHPYDFLQFMQGLYGFFTGGYWDKSLSHNETYKKMLNGEKIDSKRMGEWHHDWKLVNTDFTPYAEALDYYNDWWGIYNSLDYIYRVKGKIAQCMEMCIWVNEAKKTLNDGEIRSKELFSIISDMRRYVYVDEEKMLTFEKNIGWLANNGENMKTKAFIKNVFGTMIDKFDDISELENIIDQKKQLLEMAWFKGANGNEIGNYCLALLEERLAILLKNSEEFKEKTILIRKQFSDLLPVLEKRFSLLYHDKYYDYNGIIDNVNNMLAAGETLFELFVKNPSAKSLADYGCVAIEYYKSLEYIVNNVLYKPYYLNVLSSYDASAMDENGKPLKINEFSETTYGRCGESYKQMTYVKRGNVYYKDSLEYGTVARFLAGIRPLYDKSKDKNGNIISDKYQAICNFYSNAGLSIEKISDFGKQMSLTSDARNQCAHPKIQGKDFAINARMTIYEKGNSEIEKVDDIYELIARFLELLR